MIQLPNTWIREKYKELTSTMDIACERISEGPVNGLLISTEHQTGGRGRNEKARWIDEPGANLLCTCVLACESMDVANSPRSALAVLQCIRRCIVLHSQESPNLLLKWPNDVLLDDKKIAGILLEWRKKHLLIGIGINVNQKNFSLPAHSLANACKTELDIDFVTDILLDELHSVYSDDAWHKVAEQYLMGMNTEITIDAPPTRKKGMLIGLDASGALCIEDREGRRELVHLGRMILT